MLIYLDSKESISNTFLYVLALQADENEGCCTNAFTIKDEVIHLLSIWA